MSDDGDDDEAERRGDPFEHLAEDVRDREGDPFESLAGEGDPDAEPGPRAGAPEEPADRDPLGDTGEPSGSVGEAEAGEPAEASPRAEHAEPTPGEPTPSQVSDMDAARERQGDPFGEADSAFTEMDVADLEPEQVWEELSDAEDRGSVTEVREHVYAEVDKHRYCESCEYFSAPPEVSCSHEGTEILEFVDLGTVRVVDCPIVAERRELEDEA